LELSQHQYRLDIFPNHTNYKDNLDIVAFQNGSNLTKMQIKVLEKLGIFYSHTNLINQGNLTIKNQQNDQINHNIIKFTGEAASRRL